MNKYEIYVVTSCKTFTPLQLLYIPKLSVQSLTYSYICCAKSMKCSSVYLGISGRRSCYTQPAKTESQDLSTSYISLQQGTSCYSTCIYNLSILPPIVKNPRKIKTVPPTILLYFYYDFYNTCSSLIFQCFFLRLCYSNLILKFACSLCSKLAQPCRKTVIIISLEIMGTAYFGEGVEALLIRKMSMIKMEQK